MRTDQSFSHSSASAGTVARRGVPATDRQAALLLAFMGTVAAFTFLVAPKFGAVLPVLNELTPSPAQAPTEGHKWALLVGVTKYESAEVTPLKYPVRDVDAVSGALQKLGFEKERILTMTSDAPRTSGLYPTSKNVLAQLTSLANNVKPDDTFVFYFSGHSFPVTISGKKVNCLATVNANPLNPTSLEATTVSLDKLRAKMRAIPAEQVLYLMDAHRNDPTPGQEDSDNPRTAAFSADMKRVLDETGAEGRKGAAPPRVAVLYANKEGARSYEDDAKKQGVFAEYLLDSLSGKGANDKRQMAADSIAKFVTDTVAAGWNRQNPARAQYPELVARSAADGPALVLLPYRPGDLVANNPVEKVDTLARLQVKTTPPEATIRINGQSAADGTYSTNLVDTTEKDVEVTVTAPEYEGQVLKAKLLRGKLVEVAVTLNKAAPAPPPIPTNGKDNAEIVKIPAGDFQMGSDDSESFADADEKPKHRVHTNQFIIYRNLVSVGQYKQFCAETNRSMPEPPPYNADWSDEDLPMVNVRYDDATAYAVWAGGEDNNGKPLGRLPTEAEWERAARGDSGNTYPWGMNFDDAQVWGSVNTPRTRPAGVSREKNISVSPFGVRDMVGNVSQWCSDWYQQDYYRSSPTYNPDGPKINGFYRVLRGGTFQDKYAKQFRASKRFKGGFSSKSPYWGFRVVLPVYSTLRQIQ